MKFLRPFLLAVALAASAVACAQNTAINAGNLASNRMQALSRGGYTTEALALFAKMTVQPNRTRKILINSTIVALKTSGVWAKQDVLYMLWAHDQQASRLNWKNPGTFTLTENNSPTWTVDRGYTGDGVSMSLSATWGGTLFTQNDASVFAVGLTNGNAANTLTLANSAAAVRGQVRARNTTSAQTAAGAGTVTVAVTGGAVPLVVGGDRSDSANQSIFINGALDVTTAVGSVALGTKQDVFVLSNGTIFSSQQVAALGYGGSLGASGHAALDAAIKAFAAGVGVTLP